MIRNDCALLSFLRRRNPRLSAAGSFDFGVAAVVRADPEATRPDEAAVIGHVEAKLADFKAQQRVCFL